jgi:DNA excision repair protein ERCC-4
MSIPMPSLTVSSPRIVIDDREPHELVAHALRSCGCSAIEVRRLTIGDYVVNESLLVERKSLRDLIVSIIDGRLFQQAKRLADADLPAALILEGTTQDIQHSEMRWEAIQGALVSVSLFFGVPVLRSRNLEETARTLFHAARQNAEVETDALVRHARRPKRKAALQSYILQGLPGVGPKRAKQLIERFGSVGAVMNASALELAAIEGFGPRTIHRIRDVIQ